MPPGFERPFKTSIDALDDWRPHILRYFEHRFTCGYVERLNGLTRKMDRNGAGYSYDVLRAKALLKHGFEFVHARAADRPQSDWKAVVAEATYEAGFHVRWNGDEVASVEARA